MSSIQNGRMMRSTSASKQDRLAKIKEEFQEIDKNGDKQLSFEEINNYLSKKSGKPFDPQLLKEIFNTLDKDQNSVISLDEFVNGYYQAETLVKSRVDVLKQEIKENTQKSADTKRQFIEAKANKGDKKNILTVNVQKAENLGGGILGNKAPVVKISCEGQEITTNPTNPDNPIWDETFSFTVTNGTGDILIEVFDSNKGKITNFLGEVSVPFDALRDQQMHEDNIELVGKKITDRVSGSIEIGLQWVYDLPSYLEGIISQFDAAINEDKQELAQIEKYYQDLQSPLAASVIGSDWILQNPKFKKAEQQFSDKMDAFSEKTFGKPIAWSLATQLSIYLLLILSCLSMYVRPDFPNLTIGVIALIYFLQKSVSSNYKILALAILASEIYDLIWLWTSMSKWVDEEGVEKNVKKIIVFVSVINFIGKIAIGAVFWKNSIG
ncbi:unnamed protein product [Blepharisma stoltei]|uniref:Uncharacterized protein n=1 Tax=Blepharisma stoltei TaxID=1481888 RepID=A0AAU9JWM8_9CILI|nr:unnamed protein product [Blepharisma stoltei]